MKKQWSTDSRNHSISEVVFIHDLRSIPTQLMKLSKALAKISNKSNNIETTFLSRYFKQVNAAYSTHQSCSESTMKPQNNIRKLFEVKNEGNPVGNYLFRIVSKATRTMSVDRHLLA